MDLLTVSELAALLRVPVSWIYARTCPQNAVGETLPHYKLGRHLRFKRDEVLEWIEKHHKKESGC